MFKNIKIEVYSDDDKNEFIGYLNIDDKDQLQIDRDKPLMVNIIQIEKNHYDIIFTINN